MIQKFQQGGQQEAIMQFVQGIAQTLKADPQQIVQIAQQNPEALQQAVQVYQQTQDINQAAQTFVQAAQQRKKAAHGAKLNYIKRLKHQCADDEEVVYYKKGGIMGCDCQKKQDGGQVTKQKQKSDPTKDFKNRKQQNKPEQEKRLDPKTTKTLPGGKYPKYWTSKERQIWEREHGPNDEGLGAHKQGGEIKKDCGGSKMKIKSAGAGCIAEFKRKFRQGGSLNRISFV